MGCMCQTPGKDGLEAETHQEDNSPDGAEDDEPSPTAFQVGWRGSCMAASVRCPARFLLPIRLDLRCAHIWCRGQVFQDRKSPAIMAGGFFYQVPGPLNC